MEHATFAGWDYRGRDATCTDALIYAGWGPRRDAGGSVSADLSLTEEVRRGQHLDHLADCGVHGEVGCRGGNPCRRVDRCRGSGDGDSGRADDNRYGNFRWGGACAQGLAERRKQHGQHYQASRCPLLLVAPATMVASMFVARAASTDVDSRLSSVDVMDGSWSPVTGCQSP